MGFGDSSQISRAILLRFNILNQYQQLSNSNECVAFTNAV